MPPETEAPVAPVAPPKTSILIAGAGDATERFKMSPFGVPTNYTGAVVLSPGPGMDLGLSAAAACNCCSGESRLYITYLDGEILTISIREGRKTYYIQGPLTLPVTGSGYFKVSFIPGQTDLAGLCCKCLTNAYELSIPEDSTAKNFSDLAKTLKPRGTTAKSIKALVDRVAELEEKVRRLGGDTAIDNPDTEAEIKDLISRLRSCGC